MHKFRPKDIIVVGLTVALIAGAGVETSILRAKPANGDSYQEHIRDTFATVPMRVDNWIGHEYPLPKAAMALLHPNVAAGREYTDFISGNRAQVMLVQCTDARDMFGHYPPNCYPGQGWVLERHQERDWSIDGISIQGTQYWFTGGPLGPSDHGGIVVQDFMMLPDGEFARNMASMRKLAIQWRFFGAGQIQVVTSANMSDEERDQAFNTLVTAYAPVIRAIQSGTTSLSKTDQNK